MSWRKSQTVFLLPLIVFLASNSLLQATLTNSGTPGNVPVPSGSSSNSSSGSLSNHTYSESSSTNITVVWSTNSSGGVNTSQSSNSSWSTNTTVVWSTNSSGGVNTSQSSNSSWSTNTTVVSSTNSSGVNTSQSSNSSWSYNSSSQANSSEWKTAYWYSRSESQWNFQQWLSYFMQVESTTTVVTFNYAEWYSYISSFGALECDSESFVTLDSAIIINLIEALSLSPEMRKDSCVSLKAVIKLAKTTQTKCMLLHGDDWSSFSELSVMQYSAKLRISVYKTIQRLVCSSYEESSESNMDEGEGTWAATKIRNYLLGFIRLQHNWEGYNGSICSDASEAIETVQEALNYCPWEVRSALSLIVSQMNGFWRTVCTSPTCNIYYVDVCLSSALMTLEEADDMNVSYSQNDTQQLCEQMKYVMATSLNHTIDCQRSTYSAVSSKIDLLKTEYSERCGEVYQEPHQCVVVEHDLNDITGILGQSFFVNKATVCQAANNWNVTDSGIRQYCEGSLTDTVMSCFSSNFSSSNCSSSDNNTCDKASSSKPNQLQAAHACLTSQGVPEFIFQKAQSFMSLTMKHISGDLPACVSPGDLNHLISNITFRILTGAEESSFCVDVDSEISKLLDHCGEGHSVNDSIFAVISLVCPALKFSTNYCDCNCNSYSIKTCYDAVIDTSFGQDLFLKVDQCVEPAVSSCPSLISSETRATLKQLTDANVFIAAAAENDPALCVCDAAAAVNCILDVHHEAKAETPDYEELCPLVSQSETCARSYIQGCDDCKKTTVMSIVEKLNDQLEETCENPPVTQCHVKSALQCVTDLIIQTSAAAFSDEAICIQITIARQCVQERTKNCDEVTSFSVTRSLEQTISKWTTLKCSSPEDQLKNCSAVFESRIYAVLGMNKNALWKALEKNDSTLWNNFTTWCMEADFTFSCLNASLGLEEDDIDAVIVRKTLQALYVTVSKICKQTQEPLKCYSCEGNGQNSCTKQPDTKACHTNEICETDTLLTQNTSMVTFRGCKPRTSCKPGCDKNGCTYCCSDNLCNNLDNGPVEGTCNLTAAAGCVLGLSAGYIKNDNFQCSSAKATVDCIKSVQLQCEIGGASASIESLTKLNLTAEIQMCLIQEAVQTCEVSAFTTTISYISQSFDFQLNKSELCGVIAESRERVAQAALNCSKDQYLAIVKAQKSLEAVVGRLDCEDHNITINIECKSIDALSCMKTVRNANATRNNLTCQTFTEIKDCIRAQVNECTSAPQLSFVNTQVEWIKSMLPYDANCSDVKPIEQENMTMTNVSKCIQKFSLSIKDKGFEYLFDAALELQTCFYDISVEILTLTASEQLALEIIVQFIEQIIEIKFKGELNLHVNVSEVCHTSLSKVVYKHSTTIVGISFLSLDQRVKACSGLDDDLMEVQTNCNLEVVSDILKVLDITRKRFFIGFCPEIKDIPRCQINVSEECYMQYSATFGPGSQEDVCIETEAYVKCAASATETCDYQDSETFRQQAAISVDIASQVCTDNPELIEQARCKLLGREDAEPGCAPLSILSCGNNKNKNCSTVEDTIACYVKNAGTCPNSIATAISTSIISKTLDEITECRYGNSSQRVDISVLTTPCSKPQYKCDITKSLGCLDALVQKKGSIAEAKKCLEDNYYCLAPVDVLFLQNIERYASLIIQLKDITPDWSKYESKFLIEVLIISSYFHGFLDQDEFINLRLYDMCWKLSEILDKLEDLSDKYSKDILPTIVRNIEKIRNLIPDMCNTGEVSEELVFPPNGQENQKCPVNVFSAQISIMLSQAITEVYTVKQLRGNSICSIYTSLQASVEASAQASFSLKDCSLGFQAKTKFAMKMAKVFLEDQCETPDYDIPRCDAEMAQRCTNNLYSNLMHLGKTQTIPGLCKVYEETEACVQKYSFQCADSIFNRIKLKFESVKKSAQQKCTPIVPPPKCEDKDNEVKEKCDIAKATKCACKQFKDFLNPFMSIGSKCSNLYNNLDCISKGTENCDGLLPEIVNVGANKLKNLISDLGCKGKNEDNKPNFGCREGCWIDKAFKCFEVFHSRISTEFQSSLSKTTCQYISELTLCVDLNIHSCQSDESASVLQTLDATLEKYPGREDKCIDVYQCSSDFDDLARLILNLKQQDDYNHSGDDGDDNDDGDNDDGDNDDDDDDEDDDDDDDDTSNNGASPDLISLCTKVQQKWSCLQRGIPQLPQQKQDILKSLYDELWEAVEETCSETKPRECYVCKNSASSKDCEVNTMTCPYNKQTCMFKQVLTGKGIKYSAGCSPAKKCSKDTNNVHTYYCTSDLCNKRANSAATCQLETDTCSIGLSLKCALDFLSNTIQSENYNCSYATTSLSCIQKYGANCNSAKSLFDVTSSIYFKLASHSCVVNPAPGDCTSYAITSLTTILGSAYATEGNTLCLSLQKTNASVNELIAGGTCSQNGVISLKLMLSFIYSITGNYCSNDVCPTSDLINARVETPKFPVFDGIQYLYKSFRELGKDQSARNCGASAHHAVAAHLILDGSKISSFVIDAQKTLDSDLAIKCQIPTLTTLPEICQSVCQASVVLNFTDEIAAGIGTHENYSCWYLSRVMQNYQQYTSSCTSVQQRDIIVYIKSALGEYVEICQKEIPDFTFVLDIKKDIYYNAINCSNNFQMSIESAFLNNDQEEACEAVSKLKNCSLGLPEFAVGMVFGPSKEIMDTFEKNNICADMDRKRRETSVCQLEKLAHLISELVIPTNIPTAALDCRNKYCLNNAKHLDEAVKLFVECGDGLSKFQIFLYNSVVANAKARMERLCPPQIYEVEKCDISRMAECRADFSVLSGYATVGVDALCRKASFALECSSRYSKNCSSSDNTTALAVLATTKTVIKWSLGNSCPLLTSFLYCDGSLPTKQEACQLDKAKECRSHIFYDFTKEDDPNYCQSLSGNVNCVKSLLSGCQADQVTSVGLPVNARNGMCGIPDFTLNNVCTSVPVCSTQTVVACFAQANPTSCSSLQAAMGCMTSYFSNNKKQCQQSLGYGIYQYYLSVFYGSLAKMCGVKFDTTIPDPYSSACVGNLVSAVDLALSIRKTATAAEVLNYVFETLSTCLNKTSEDYVTVVTLIQEIIIKIKFNSEVKLIEYNQTTENYYTDTNNCFYSRARACLGSLIIKTATFKLFTPDQRSAFCDEYNSNSVDDCISSALTGCPQTDKDQYAQITAIVNQNIQNIGMCDQPQLCIPSEAYECINTFGEAIAKFDDDNDTQALCIARRQAEECVDKFLFKCSPEKAQPVKDTLKTLSDQVEPICSQVVLPKPPICPDIQVKNRVCFLGNAFLCLATFNFELLQNSDSLIIRQHCLNIQKTTYCIASNLTSCDENDKDVKIIKGSLYQFQTAIGYQCPWLTGDFCSLEKPCPVSYSGCDVDLERGLINREDTVCDVIASARQCVEKYTQTCTEAQKKQATTVIDNKVSQLGIPKDLSCQNGSIDGFLLSFLAATRDSYLHGNITETCSLLTSQYLSIQGQYSNPDHSSYLDLAMNLINKLKSTVYSSQCSAANNKTCTDPLPIKELTNLISQLALNKEFSTTSFCAQSLTILHKRKTNDCYSDLYDAIMKSDAYNEDCASEETTCADAAVKIKSCVLKIGVFSQLSCDDKQKAALCVTQYLPAKCPYDASLFSGKLCPENVVLQASADQGSHNFISECGLSLKAGFKLVDGNSSFSITMASESANESSVPRCLESSGRNNQIAQIATEEITQSLGANSTEITFTLKAIQDYRTDGSQEVIVKFELQIINKTYPLSVFTVNVEDCDQPHSTCSVINDPHINTPDKMGYNNMQSGKFLLYRHKEIAQAVVVEFKKCADYGTCTCAVYIFAGNSSVEFNKCQRDANYINYQHPHGTDQNDEQLIVVHRDADLMTFYVTLVETGTIIIVVEQSEYLQIYIQPSGLDVGKIEGLCGDYDGNGANDLVMKDGTTYKLTEDDTYSNIIAPSGFISNWQIQDIDDKESIIALRVSPSNEEERMYCVNWDTGSNETIKCSHLALFDSCAIVKGEDVTTSLLALNKQSMTTNSKRRKKRQAVSETTPEQSTAPLVRKWSEVDGWTQSEATDRCMDLLNDVPLQACRSALLAQNNPIQLLFIDYAIIFCADDVRATGGLHFINGTHQALSQLCQAALHQNPVYQSNSSSSELALAYLNMTCFPYDCNGHGKCYQGVCICDPNYVGTGCNVNINSLTPPVLISVSEVYFCEIGIGSECNSVFLTGNNFISSSKLSCHMREVEISAVQDSTAGQITVVKGELITSNQVKCNIGSKNFIMRTVEVSVSNDGKTAYQAYQKFIAYDPACYDCTFETCTRKWNVCIIGNRCVPEGESSVYSDCQYCNLNKPNDWSIRPGMPECEHLIPESDKDKQTLTTALIAVGCSLAGLLIIVITVCVLLRRRDAKKRRNAARRNEQYNLHHNNDRMPFDGRPVTAYKPKEGFDHMSSPPQYQQYA